MKLRDDDSDDSEGKKNVGQILAQGREDILRGCRYLLGFLSNIPRPSNIPPLRRVIEMFDPLTTIYLATTALSLAFLLLNLFSAREPNLIKAVATADARARTFGEKRLWREGRM